MDSFGGTLEHFAGDGIMIFFNDPMPVERPAERAVKMALEAQKAFEPIAEAWKKQGQEVGLGIGISQGAATLGLIVITSYSIHYTKLYEVRLVTSGSLDPVGILCLPASSRPAGPYCSKRRFQV